MFCRALHDRSERRLSVVDDEENADKVALLRSALVPLRRRSHQKSSHAHKDLGRLGGRKRKSRNSVRPLLAPVPQCASESGDREVRSERSRPNSRSDSSLEDDSEFPPHGGKCMGAWKRSAQQTAALPLYVCVQRSGEQTELPSYATFRRYCSWHSIQHRGVFSPDSSDRAGSRTRGRLLQPYDCRCSYLCKPY